MAIILNILGTMCYVFEEINLRWCRHNTVPLSFIMSTVGDGVSPSLKGGGGVGSAPYKSAADLVSYTVILATSGNMRKSLPVTVNMTAHTIE